MIQPRPAHWLTAIAVLGGCRSSAPVAPSSPDSAMQVSAEAAIHALFDACAAGEPSRVMARVAYQGHDPSRRYRSPWRAEDADAMAVATGLCSVLPTEGAIELLELTTRPPTPQTASDWTITIVQRGETRLFLAFVEVDGALLLGELQPVS